MSRLAVPQSHLVKREEKEDKLERLLRRHLGALAESTPCDAAETNCLLIARSADSPVAKLLLFYGAAGSLKRFSVRAIFAFLGTAETVRIAEACRASEWSLQVHWARDLRLLEAHEQLVLGSATCWIGDSMRREPLSHDACELYAPDCPELTYRARRFFERLWQASEPVFERQGFGAGEAFNPALMQPVDRATTVGGRHGPRTSA